jgi:hypothetical protein
MYRAKSRHGSRRQVRSMRELSLAGRNTGLAADLPGTLGRGELHLSYEPIVEAATGRMTAVEALLRWTPRVVDGCHLRSSSRSPNSQGRSRRSDSGCWRGPARTDSAGSLRERARFRCR